MTPRISNATWNVIKQMLESKEVNVTQVSYQFNISRNSIYRHAKMNKWNILIKPSISQKIRKFFK